jgi:hypothetical protein
MAAVRFCPQRIAAPRHAHRDRTYCYARRARNYGTIAMHTKNRCLLVCTLPCKHRLRSAKRCVWVRMNDAVSQKAIASEKLLLDTDWQVRRTYRGAWFRWLNNRSSPAAQRETAILPSAASSTACPAPSRPPAAQCSDCAIPSANADGATGEVPPFALAKALSAANAIWASGS